MIDGWTPIVGKPFTAAEFAEYCANFQMGDWKPKFVVLHNTGAPKLSQWHSVPGPSRMANLQHFYRDEQGWSAGPHLFVADDEIWVFTPLNVQGVHSPSWNRVAWGVEMVGDYSAESFPAAVHDNAVAALAALHKLGNIDPDTLKFHKEDPETTHRDCPGTNVSKPDILAALKAALQ